MALCLCNVQQRYSIPAFFLLLHLGFAIGSKVLHKEHTSQRSPVRHALRLLPAWLTLLNASSHVCFAFVSIESPCEGMMRSKSHAATASASLANRLLLSSVVPFFPA